MHLRKFYLVLKLRRNGGHGTFKGAMIIISPLRVKASLSEKRGDSNQSSRTSNKMDPPLRNLLKPKLSQLENS